MNLPNRRSIHEGDMVILYERKDSLIPITVTKGEKYSCILGAFCHDDMIGKEYGSIVILFANPHRIDHFANGKQVHVFAGADAGVVVELYENAHSDHFHNGRQCHSVPLVYKARIARRGVG